MSEVVNSVPENLKIDVVGLPSQLESMIKQFLSEILNLIGHKMNLSSLDGVTFALDYHQALLDLDRGYETNFKLQPSNDHGVGVAMSPSVIRNGELKTHVLISAPAFFSMLEAGRTDMLRNIVAHECAHVELNRLFEESFPKVLLHSKQNVLDHFRIECMLTCWNEFGACWRSAEFGPTDVLHYESAFLPALEEARSSANEAIMQYRTHGDVSVVVNKVCGLYSALLKYSAYHLGNLYGHGIDWRTVPSTTEPLNDHWFLPYFERLDSACKAIAMNIGNWKACAAFDELKDIAEEVVADGGMHFKRHEEDRISLDIPMTIETMPVPPQFWR